MTVLIWQAYGMDLIPQKVDVMFVEETELSPLAPAILERLPDVDLISQLREPLLWDELPAIPSYRIAEILMERHPIVLFILNRLSIAYSFNAHAESIAAVALNRQGSLLLTASEDATAKIWDLNTKRLYASLVGHHKGLQKALFNHDSQLALTLSKDGSVKV